MPRKSNISRRCRATITALLVLFLSSLSSSPAAEFSGRVVGVADGDTISVLRDGRVAKVRLSSIDCPEKKQAFGQEAKRFTSQLCFGKTVWVYTNGADRYGRYIGEVQLPDGTSLNRQLVAAGLAWCYSRYNRDDEIRSLENRARDARRGLWSSTYVTPPWTYRESRRSMGAQPTVGLKN